MFEGKSESATVNFKDNYSKKTAFESKEAANKRKASKTSGEQLSGNVSLRGSQHAQHAVHLRCVLQGSFQTQHFIWLMYLWEKTKNVPLSNRLQAREQPESKQEYKWL